MNIHQNVTTGYILNNTCKCVEIKKTRKRCPNGTIKNKATGKCEPKIANKTANKTAKKQTTPIPTKTTRKRCPNGTIRNKKTGNCEPKTQKNVQGVK